MLLTLFARRHSLIRDLAAGDPFAVGFAVAAAVFLIGGAVWKLNRKTAGD
jgi:hypothetical protein